MMTLINDDIRVDVKKYEARIEKANEKLNNLPETAYGWQAEKALNKKRRDLIAEIEHCENLIRIASEALPNED